MTNRPLSHTKRGKLLAVIGGLAGGPLGVIVSPLVLMLINANKKEGNRFFIWFAVGVPICAGLWFIQLLAITPIIIALGDPWRSDDYLTHNGMEYWENSPEAKKMMKNPDWCNHNIKWSGLDGTHILECFSRDWTTKEKNDHKVIRCEMTSEFQEHEFRCTMKPNRQFTDQQMSTVNSNN